MGLNFHRIHLDHSICPLLRGYIKHQNNILRTDGAGNLLRIALRTEQYSQKYFCTALIQFLRKAFFSMVNHDFLSPPPSSIPTRARLI